VSYTPKYVDIAGIKRAVYPDAEQLTDALILDAIEQGERETDDWLAGCDFDPANLTSEQKEGAKGMAICYTVLRLIPKLPLTRADMRSMYEEWESRLARTQQLFIGAEGKMPGAVYKRMTPGYGKKWGNDV